MIEPLILLIALLCGMLARAFKLPALIGYLAAGFVLHELAMESGPLIDQLAEVGITLMLFTIGLKLIPKQLLAPQIWLTTTIHMGVSILVIVALVGLLSLLVGTIALDQKGVWLVAFALSFSSTVFVVQVLQERGEAASIQAQIAVGILIVQDLIAVSFLAISAGKIPEWSAFLLLLLIPMRPALIRLMPLAGYGELLTLLGLALALGAAEVSEWTGIKGDLGALFTGAVLAGHPKSKAMASNLIHLKDLFLIGFFLSIGLGGWPNVDMIIVAVLLGLTAACKPLLYFPLLTRLHASPRHAVLSASSLANHSEFGLIVVAVAVATGALSSDWASAMSIAVAVSFVIGTPIANRGHRFYAQHRERLLRWQTGRIQQQLPNTQGVTAIILGMGRVGTGAYEALAPEYGSELLGVESESARVEQHIDEHRRVVLADASDPDFWFRVRLDRVSLIMLALTNHSENMRVAELLREQGYRSQISAVVRHEEHAEDMRAIGVSAFNLYAQAGAGFAAHASLQSEEVRGSAITND